MEYLSASGKEKKKRPILFLHGAYCDGWVWREHFLNYFSNQGYDCYCLDFKHADNIFESQTINLDTYVAQVLSAINQIGETPIMVAHSMAAAVLNKLYAKRPLNFPAWVMMTPAPPRNFYESSQDMLLKNPTLFSQMYMLQMLGKGFVSPNLAKYALFSDEFDDKKAQSYLDNIKHMPNGVIFDIMTLNISDDALKVDFPVMIQAAKQDRLISSRSLEVSEQTFNTKAKYYNSGHALMLDDCWQEVAKDIVKFLDKEVK